MRDVRLISFGYLHAQTPTHTTLRIDVRTVLYDPAARGHLLDLDGRHPQVADLVLRNPLARAIVTLAADLARAGADTIAIGCAGGRHRSVALIEAIAAELANDPDMRMTVEHRHVDRPRTPLSQRSGETA